VPLGQRHQAGFDQVETGQHRRDLLAVRKMIREEALR
jgi:hypothetical protein